MIDPAPLARRYVEQAREAVAAIGETPVVRGFIATDDKPSVAYANNTRQAFIDAGFEYQLHAVQRLQLERAITEANEDAQVHGVFTYFPVFGNQQDSYLRNLVHYTKDVEAGSQHWTHKLYRNDRLAVHGDASKKALLPCTPLAIVKILTELGEYGKGSRPLARKVVTIFNRSEVVGRPLAMMMSNDGAKVYSFDVNGPLTFIDAEPGETNVTRCDALSQSDIVITGVPGNNFDLIGPGEVNANAVCINFSSSDNFDPAVADSARLYVPRIGPMTVAMCMRNTLRLYTNFHQP